MALNNQTQSTEDRVQDLDFANKPSEVSMEPVADAASPSELAIEEGKMSAWSPNTRHSVTEEPKASEEVPLPKTALQSCGCDSDWRRN